MTLDFDFKFSVLCPACGNLTEFSHLSIEVIANGVDLGICECGATIQCHLAKREPTVGRLEHRPFPVLAGALGQVELPLSWSKRMISQDVISKWIKFRKTCIEIMPIEKRKELFPETLEDGYSWEAGGLEDYIRLTLAAKQVKE